VFALEGGGDLVAAFLKNRRTHNHQEPKGRKKDQGAHCCRHRILLGGRFVPDLFSSVKWRGSGEATLETQGGLG
jgi:hypothetical protein